MRHATPDRPAGRVTIVHPLTVRLTHWINALAMAGMIGSGWAIYNASPFFPFSFPRWATLGSWLGASLAWHFAAMWLLVANGLLYVAYGLATRHFARSFLPLSARMVWTDFRAALGLRLAHRLGTYNAVQRLSYVVALVLGLLLVLSGLSLWKPVQLQDLASLLGGYEGARRVHFLAMSGLVLFIVVHLALVALVPATLPSMITGRATLQPDAEAKP
jgi:thiosulfate reductase cytochrome b subunit